MTTPDPLTSPTSYCVHLSTPSTLTGTILDMETCSQSVCFLAHMQCATQTRGHLPCYIQCLEYFLIMVKYLLSASK